MKTIWIVSNLLKKLEIIILLKGEHIINKPLFIASGKNLIINGGTTLRFSNKSYVYVENGNLIMNGTPSEKINLSSFSNSTWGGIFVSNSKTHT